MASVCVGVWVGTGGRREPADLCGISHFIEHMLFKGTRRRTARQISQAVEGIGGYLNAFTTEEATCLYARARHDRFEELLDVLMDMLLQSRFDPADIAKERAVIKEELAMYLDQPHQRVQELLNETLWPDHPLGRSLTGTERTIDRMRRTRLLDYLRSNYRSEAVVIAVAGRVTHAGALRLVRPCARRIPPGRPGACLPAPPPGGRPVARLLTKEIEQTQIALGFRTGSRHDERRFALRLLNTLLGENMSSRLFQVVREDQGLAYSIFSSVGAFDDTGLLTVSAGVETGKLERALRLILRELGQARERVPAANELRQAKDYVLGQMELSLESTENRMMWLAEQWLGYRRVFPPGDIKNRIATVTPSDVRAAARAYLQPDRAALALVGPVKSCARLERMLVF